MNEFRFAHVWGVGLKSENRGWGLWDNRVYDTRREAEDAMRELKAQINLHLN